MEAQPQSEEWKQADQAIQMEGLPMPAASAPASTRPSSNGCGGGCSHSLSTPKFALMLSVAANGSNSDQRKQGFSLTDALLITTGEFIRGVGESGQVTGFYLMGCDVAVVKPD
jgi:hypothetical protein